MSDSAVNTLLAFGILALFVGGGVGLFVFYNRARPADDPATFEAQRAEQRGAGVEVEVGLRPEAVVDAAVGAMLRAGYRLENRAQNTVTFARYRGVEVACIGCLLMLLLLLPGLLYLIFAQKTARLTIAAHPIEGGSRLVIGGGSPEGVRMAAQWARGLPRPDEVPLPELSEQPTTGPQGLASPREAPDVPEQI